MAAAFKIQIQGEDLTVDTVALADLKGTLAQYHGRLATEAAEAGDMQVASEMAAQMLEVQDAYDALETSLPIQR